MGGAYAATYYVATTGSNANNGSQSAPWRDINRAVGASSPIVGGDTVLIEPGTYTENVSIEKSGTDSARITLKAKGAVTVVDPDYEGHNWQTGVIVATNQRNLTLDGIRVSRAGWGGFTLRSCANVTVQNCSTYQSGGSGIIALPLWNGSGPLGATEVVSSNIKVLNCVVEEANQKLDQEAISIWGVDGFEVANCKVFNGRTEGIDAKVGSRNGTIHHNELYGNASWSGRGRNGGPAIYVEASRANLYNVQVYNNLVHDNQADAITVSSEGVGTVDNVRIYNNITYGNGILGVNGGQGVAITTGTNISVYNNTSVGDIIGFQITGGAFGAPLPSNVFYRNNMVIGPRYKSLSVYKSAGLLVERNIFSPTLNEEGDNSALTKTNNLVVADALLSDLWHLTAASPAIDSATTIGGTVAATDYENQARPQGAGYDIGADEFATATPTPTPAGVVGITRELWSNIGGTNVSDIPLNDTPTSTSVLSSFEAPTNVGDNYGQRLRGLLTAPTTGAYTFWIAGDDNCELWLSTNDQAGSKVKIAGVSGWTFPREWNKYASQKSVTINLVAGQRYYIEALMKEATGGDNLAVGWAKPGQSAGEPSEVVPGTVLSPYGS